MAQNIYDDPGFFDGYARLRRSTEGLDGAPEWPALRAMLPNLHGTRVLDLGCGFGWFCRHARAAGAKSVLGVDVSAKMLARAQAETDGPAITYQRADLETFELPDAAFDLVHSSLALHYLADLGWLIAQIRRGLRRGGHLVFSVEHPIYTAPASPGWRLSDDGCKTWPVEGYQSEGARVTDWLARGVVKQHRPIGTYVNLLIDHGLVITRLEEWGPSAAQIEARPELAEERERPMFLLLSARRA
jgi:SAM-dependent methyltransferase